MKGKAPRAGNNIRYAIFIIAALLMPVTLHSPTGADASAVQMAEMEEEAIYGAACEDYAAEVYSYSGWDADIVMLIIEAESGCDPSAVGDGHLTFASGTMGMSCGLGQVRVLEGRPGCDELKDPYANIFWMHQIWDEQGYGAWSVCRNGKVDCGL